MQSCCGCDLYINPTDGGACIEEAGRDSAKLLGAGIIKRQDDQANEKALNFGDFDRQGLLAVWTDKELSFRDDTHRHISRSGSQETLGGVAAWVAHDVNGSIGIKQISHAWLQGSLTG